MSVGWQRAAESALQAGATNALFGFLQQFMPEFNAPGIFASGAERVDRLRSRVPTVRARESPPRTCRIRRGKRLNIVPRFVARRTLSHHRHPQAKNFVDSKNLQ